MSDTGVVSNEDDLRKFFDNYIMQPVLTKAVPSSEDQQGDRQDYRYACLITLITRPYAAKHLELQRTTLFLCRTKLTAVGVAAIVALLVWKVKGSQ